MSEIAYVPLRDLLSESQNGLSKRRGDAGSAIAVLRLADISHGNIDESNPREIQLTEKEVEKYAMQQGDLVCIRVNGSKNLVGRVITFRSERAWAYCDHFIRLRPRHDIVDYRYLAHFFESRQVRRHVELNMVSSAGQNTVSQGTMLDVVVPTPPLVAQRELVAELEKQFSRLDEAVANLKRVKANLKRYKASVLKDAVEGRLVPTEAELARREGRSFESGDDLLQRLLEKRRIGWKGRGKYKEPVAVNIDGLADLPEGWTWATIEQLTCLVTSGSRGWGDFYSDIGVLFIRAQDIKTDVLNLRGLARVDVPADAEGSRSSVGENDILVTITGANVTKSALVPRLSEPAFVSQHVALLKLVSSGSAAFVFDWLVSPANGRKTLERWAYGAGKPGLSLEQVRALPVAFPPQSEQTRIVDEVECRLSVCRKVEVEVDSNLKRAGALRQSTLAQAFKLGSTHRDSLE